MNNTDPFFDFAHIQYPRCMTTPYKAMHVPGQMRCINEDSGTYALPDKASASEVKSEDFKAGTFSCAADYRARISVGNLHLGPLEVQYNIWPKSCYGVFQGRLLCISKYMDNFEVSFP